MMKKFMKRLWEKKDSKKGFTLVELIVVLVILAILAAIMVPALLGWIDEAKQKQYVLEARNVYMAAQAQASTQYAAGTSFNLTGSAVEAEIEKLADVLGVSITSVIPAGSTGHDAYTIADFTVAFTSSDGTAVTATLAGGNWTITTP